MHVDTQELSIGEAGDHLDAVVDRVVAGHERIVLTNSGRRVAVMVSMQDLEILEALEDEADARAAFSALHDPDNAGQRPTWSDVKAQLAL